MKSTFIITCLLTSAFAIQSQIYDEFYGSTDTSAYIVDLNRFGGYSAYKSSLNESNGDYDSLTFDVIPLLKRAAKALAPTVIDDAIKFLQDRKTGVQKSNDERENGDSKSLKKHKTVLSWLKALASSMIDAGIKALELAKSELNKNSLDNESDDKILMVNSFDQLGVLNIDIFQNTIKARESSNFQELY